MADRGVGQPEARPAKLPDGAWEAIFALHSVGELVELVEHNSTMETGVEETAAEFSQLTGIIFVNTAIQLGNKDSRGWTKGSMIVISSSSLSSTNDMISGGTESLCGCIGREGPGSGAR